MHNHPLWLPFLPSIVSYKFNLFLYYAWKTRFRLDHCKILPTYLQFSDLPLLHLFDGVIVRYCLIARGNLSDTLLCVVLFLVFSEFLYMPILLRKFRICTITTGPSWTGVLCTGCNRIYGSVLIDCNTTLFK